MENEETILAALEEYHASEGHEGDPKKLAQETLDDYRRDVEWNISHSS